MTWERISFGSGNNFMESMKVYESKDRPTSKTDDHLWADLKDGCTTALGDLYDRYVDVLFSYGLNMSKDRGRVKDCIHDVFLDLYKYRAKLAETDNVKAYLLKCLRRKILKKGDRKVIPLQTDAFGIETLQKNTMPSYEEQRIHAEYGSEKRQKLNTAIKTLTKTQKKGLALRFDENKSYEEISRIMNTSVASARTTIYRAIKTLRKQVLFVYLFGHFHFFC